MGFLSIFVLVTSNLISAIFEIAQSQINSAPKKDNGINELK